MKGIRHGNLYTFSGTTVTRDASVGTDGSGEDSCEHTRLWHRWLGHMSKNGLDLLDKEGLLKNIKKPCINFCKNCMYGKAHKVQFLKSKNKSRGILDYVHTDVWGPAPTISKDGSRKLKTLRSDNGTEYTEDAFKKLCD
ncbi:uncharacterized protein LOC109847358 [Asparagus officinalis]|uniref:uncharacterized protein LOC109847358 n=1 Tax=Asparagus officinalis TaxID=4686 RepID=UPI00098E1551|nr:uncharacterized protein LOC109847358 [Asparagus officinalis]